MKLIFATRPSALARWQTRWVMQALQQAHPGLICEEKVVATQGDKILDKPLPKIGGKGLFTQELECELLRQVADCAVHSLKDLPVESAPGLMIGCIPPRTEVRDALISRDGYTLESLPPASVVGTSSLRRAAQVLAARPDLVTASLRGNVDTRLRKALEGQYHAIILAGAGLLRLGLEAHVTQWLPLETMLPAPAQGALAVQCRADDRDTLSLLTALDHAPTRAAVTAERQFLFKLGGGCAVPVAAYASVSREQPARRSPRRESQDEGAFVISLIGLVASPDGRLVVRVSGKGADPLTLGSELACDALAQGADALLPMIADCNPL